MRVQLDFSKQGSSAFLFYDIFKQMWSDMKITRNKEMTKYHLDIDVCWHDNTKISKRFIRLRIDETLTLAVSNFYVKDLKIGKEKKCSMCNGTGLSTYPNDISND